MSKKPILSFCIPTWNRAKRVSECVKHILSFKSDDIEVVVSDNASDDNTLELLSKIDDERLKVYSNDENTQALNWPLVVSRANGSWAALMSDEDIVLIDDIPYYLDLLLSIENDEIGAIIYRFPPIVWIPDDYVTKNCLEAIRITGLLGGHSTCKIINLSCFELGKLDGYRGFGMKTESGFFVSNPPVAEPQHEIILRIAERHKIMLSSIPLCSFGYDEQYSTSKTVASAPMWGGIGLEREMIRVSAIFHHILNAINLEQKANEVTEIKYCAAVFPLISRIIYSSATFARAAITGYHPYRPDIAKIVKKEMDFKNEDVIPFSLKYAKEMAEYICTLMPNSLIEKLPFYLEVLFSNELDVPWEYNMPFEFRVLLGELLFKAYNNIYEERFAQLSPEGIATSWDVRYSSEMPSILELRETDKMIRSLRGREYRKVLSVNSISSFRKHYLRGEAYLATNCYDLAIYEFEKFISVVENPKTFMDILTGVLSIQSSYYYLGYLYQKKGKITKSVENYYKCHNLTNKLLLGNTLSPNIQEYAR